MDGMRIIGIDAGGSKTRILAIEEEDQGKSVTTRLENDVLNPCNYRQAGSPGVRTLVKRIIDRFRIDEYRQVFIFGGFAGAASGEDHKAISSVFEEEGFEGKNIFVTSDADLLLMSLKDNGIVLVAGTGSICLGRCRSVSDRGKMIEARAGGYGYLVSNEPGGYYLGKQAIDAALRTEADSIPRVNNCIIPAQTYGVDRCLKGRQVGVSVCDHSDTQKVISFPAEASCPGALLPVT